MLKSTKDSLSSINAVLGQNASFNGTLIFDGVVRLDGNFEGTIKSNDTLVISEQADIKATIDVGVVKISGHFDGEIIARNRIELYKPARVFGHLKTPILRMEDGVILNGQIEMENVKTTPEK